MRTDLEEVIEAYEIEKKELERQISAYVEEEDYLYAHHHQKALRKINQRLDVLKTLQNPLHRHIKTEAETISHISKMLAKENNQFVKTVYEHHLARSEKEILRLKSQSIAPIIDSQEIDDALFGIVRNTSLRFKLLFGNSLKMHLQFSCVENTIYIQLYDESESSEYASLIFSKPNKLKSIGFNLQNDTWTYTYSFAVFKDALEIKILLARLVYDCLYYHGGSKSATIIYD